MERVTDWLALWRQLVEVQDERRRARVGPGQSDLWHGRAADYDAAVERRWAEPDSSRRFVIEDLDRWPGSSVLDIGAGTGSWTVMMARQASQVTAVDPSPAMLGRLRSRVAGEGLSADRRWWPLGSLDSRERCGCPRRGQTASRVGGQQ